MVLREADAQRVRCQVVEAEWPRIGDQGAENAAPAG